MVHYHHLSLRWKHAKVVEARRRIADAEAHSASIARPLDSIRLRRLPLSVWALFARQVPRWRLSFHLRRSNNPLLKRSKSLLSSAKKLLLTLCSCMVPRRSSSHLLPKSLLRRSNSHLLLRSNESPSLVKRLRLSHRLLCDLLKWMWKLFYRKIFFLIFFEFFFKNFCYFLHLFRLPSICSNYFNN